MVELAFSVQIFFDSVYREPSLHQAWYSKPWILRGGERDWISALLDLLLRGKRRIGELHGCHADVGMQWLWTKSLTIHHHRGGVCVDRWIHIEKLQHSRVFTI